MPKNLVKVVLRSLRDALIGEAWIKALVPVLSALDALLSVFARGRWAYFASGAISCFLLLFIATASAVAMKERRSYASYRKRARPGWDDLGRGTSKYAKEIPIKLAKVIATAEMIRKICVPHDLRVLGTNSRTWVRWSSRWTAIRLDGCARRLHSQLHSLERSANRFSYYERRYLAWVISAVIPVTMKNGSLTKEKAGIVIIGKIIQAGLERVEHYDNQLRRVQATRRLNAAFGLTRSRLEFARTLKNQLDLQWKAMLEAIDRAMPSASDTSEPPPEGV